MEIEQLKQIPIPDLLSSLGHEPVSRMRGGRQLMYYSPLRGDSNPSFSVSVDRNLWFDFGLSVGGNVIDLAIALNGGCSFHEAAIWLEERSRSAGFGSAPHAECYRSFHPESESEVHAIKVVHLASKSLFSYLRSRSIPPDIGSRYCKEVHYTVRGKEYFGLCFMNILGGMEIRNPFFKGSFGVKAPSLRGFHGLPFVPDAHADGVLGYHPTLPLRLHSLELDVLGSQEPSIHRCLFQGLLLSGQRQSRMGSFRQACRTYAWQGRILFRKV